MSPKKRTFPCCMLKFASYILNYIHNFDLWWPWNTKCPITHKSSEILTCFVLLTYTNLLVIFHLMPWLLTFNKLESPSRSQLFFKWKNISLHFTNCSFYWNVQILYSIILHSPFKIPGTDWQLSTVYWLSSSVILMHYLWILM